MLSITPPPQPPSYPVEISVTAEQVHVDHGTQMGMLGLSYQRLFTPQWSAGLSAYGAVTGDRGGFFAWGANGAHRQTWGPWQAEAGLFIGGGGGSPGWVGGGLMLRPHIELNRTAGAWRFGIGASHVSFPNGQVESTQPYISLRWSGTRYLGSTSGSSLIDWDVNAVNSFTAESELVGIVGTYQPTQPPGRGGVAKKGQMQYGGLAYRRSLDIPTILGATPYVGLTTLGAVGGGYDGYAELTGSVGLHWRSPQLPSLGLRIEGGIGAGGAGSTVDTGGGGLAKGSGGITWQATPNIVASASVGRVRSLGRFEANEARLELGWRFRDLFPSGPRDSSTGSSVESPSQIIWAPWNVGAGWTHYAKALRDDGTTPSLGMIALRLERQFTPNWRLVTIASTGATGRAGGYAAGQIGAAWMSSPLANSNVQWGIEASIGAAGGGSVTVNGGLIGQAQIQARYTLSPDWALQVDAGQLRGLRGNLSSPLIGISLASLFSMPEAR